MDKTVEQVELLPCPFCGGPAKFVPDHTVERCDEVRCQSCCFEISGFHHHDPKAAWNTRPLTAEIADLRAQLDEAMEALGKAQQWFAEYAESHSEKAKIAGDNEREYEARRQKARTNEQRSEYLRAILTKRKQP